MDVFFENLFSQKLFLIIYGLIGYYLVIWMIARNAKSRARDARLKLCDSKEERALVYADEQYEFKFKEWLHDQKDEMIVAGWFSAGLIELDDFALEIINRYLEDPMEMGNWIYLSGGALADLVARTVIKIRS